ncbi:MAG: UDP-N-acetylmuramate--L-alanine ligase [Mariprofundaceae bacterium]|nr:UDP-N-acetylmuramate--L-alanine ligase [Mariprofundaceae bacterium]
MKSRIQCIHLTGIGGIGMSGIAELLHNQGFSVQGSDADESPNVLKLRALGISVHIGHQAENIGNAQVVVTSSAIAKDNPEVTFAREQGIPIIPRAEMLAELMRMKQGVAIAGSHGKTTITSMIVHGMETAGLDPTYVIGGRLMATGDNAKLGGSPWLIAEADESDGSFLRLSPTIAVVSNIDPEHLDHYGDFSHLMEAFRQFVNLTPFYGRVVLHHEHPNVASLREGLHKPVTTYGSSPQADLHLIDLKPDGSGQLLTVGINEDAKRCGFRLPMPGRHNAENALAAMAVLMDLGVDVKTIIEGMESFAGIQRRFQSLSSGDGVLVDDYAHHPKEIIATLEAAASCWPEKELSVIFQPHRYSRTQDLMDEFLGAFDVAHEVTLLPIYAASESPIEGITAEAMIEGMRARGYKHISLCPDLESAEQNALQKLKDGKVVILMGAGSIGGLAQRLRNIISGANS